MQSFWMPKKQPLYAPMLATFGGGSVRGFGYGTGGGGAAWAVLSGGSVTTYTGNNYSYTQHAYTSTSTTSITISTGGLVQMLLVGAGGGGAVLGGGGGGGAVILAEGEVPAGTYNARVGDASGQRQAGWSNSTSQSSERGQSTFIDFGGSLGKVEAGPGGGGRSYSNGGTNASNQNVGNQGGWPYNSDASYVSARNPSYLSGNFTGGNIPTSFTVRNFYGGNRGGYGSPLCCPCNGGGGAGAGAQGQDNNGNNDSTNTGDGGTGVQAQIGNDYFYGQVQGNGYWWGGGGPTDAYCQTGPHTPGKGGAGGSGDDDVATNWSYGDTNGINNGTRGYPANTNNGRGGDGGANTGGGGGAGSDGSGNTNTLGGLGGSGIIVLRVGS